MSGSDAGSLPLPASCCELLAGDAWIATVRFSHSGSNVTDLGPGFVDSRNSVGSQLFRILFLGFANESGLLLFVSGLTLDGVHGWVPTNRMAFYPFTVTNPPDKHLGNTDVG